MSILNILWIKFQLEVKNLFDIKDVTIKNWCDNITYRRGIDLYNKGKVKRIDVQKK